MLHLTIPVVLAMHAVAAPPQRPVFTDPAPPRVASLDAIDAPEPATYPELTSVAAPRPLAADAVVEDWPGFLGPRRNGHSRETRLQKKWSADGPPLLWSMRRGQGYAAPAIAGKRLVYPHRVGAEAHIECLHTETGERFWQLRYPTDYRGRYIPNAGPCATPQIDGDRVYVHGIEGVLHCLELATGRVVWKRDLAADFKIPDGFFGVVSSPLIVGDLLVLNLGAPGGPTVAAFDKRSGALVWGAGKKWGASCASPLAAQMHGRTRLFVLTGGDSRPARGGLMVLDPATGAVDLEFPFRSRTYESVNGATPVVAGSRVFLTAAYGTGTAALEIPKSGVFKKIWSTRRLGIEFSTPLHVDDHLYLVDGIRDRAGAIVCIDPATGEQRARTQLDWEETVPYQAERKTLSFSIGNGSMIRADGAFLCLGDGGHLLWLECTPKGARVLARTAPFRAPESWTPPVLSRGLLYLCQNNRERFGDAPPRLLCFDLRAGE